MFNPSGEPKNVGGGNSIVAPKNCSLSTEGEDLLIHRTWGTYAGIKNLGWGVFTLAMTLGLFNTLGGQRVFASGIVSTETLALILLCVALFALGIYFLVLGLYQIVNSTTIRVTSTTVSTEHHPLPWRTREFSAPEIKQVFVTSHQEGYIIGSGSIGARNEDRFNYSVDLLMSGGNKVTLVTQLPKHDQAHFIELQIESQLGIADMRVKGEDR